MASLFRQTMIQWECPPIGLLDREHDEPAQCTLAALLRTPRGSVLLREHAVRQMRTLCGHDTATDRAIHFWQKTTETRIVRVPVTCVTEVGTGEILA